METESKLRAFYARTMERLNEQQWFQELKTKWEELDPQSRLYLKVAGAVGTALVFAVMVISSIVSVSSLKSDLNERTELLTMVRNATEELRTLKRNTQGQQGGGGGALKWSEYFGSKATSAGIETGRLTVSPEKQGNPGSMTTESMFTLELDKVNLRQAVQYAFSLESGPHPVKVKNLRMETTGSERWINARLEVSAFAMKKENR